MLTKTQVTKVREYVIHLDLSYLFALDQNFRYDVHDTFRQLSINFHRVVSYQYLHPKYIYSDISKEKKNCF